MKTTWIILLVTIAAAAGMYFYFTREAGKAPADIIRLVNTPDSVLQKIKVYTADRPVEVFYRDSAWTLADSTPLQRIMNHGYTDSISKAYKEKTLYVTYDDKLFYDMDLVKTDSNEAYKILLQFVPVADSVYVYGSIDKQSAGVINFRNPMVSMYKSFVVTYTHRLPDSLRTDDDTAAAQNKVSKLITVVEP
jgi:hypothetical protein